MQKQYFSNYKSKILAFISFVIALCVLFCLAIVCVFLNSQDFFFEILDEFFIVFVVIVIFIIAYISRAIYYLKKNQLLVAEVDDSAMYYTTWCNRMKYIYFVEIKDIYMTQDKKIVVLYKRGNSEVISLGISDIDKLEYVSLVKKNLIKNRTIG